MTKRCYWCKWGVPTIYLIGLIIISLISSLTYYFIYPLFRDYKAVITLRESNYIPSIYPVEGKITSGFYAMRGKRRHSALDIACKVNSKIRAMANGYVEKIELDAYYGVKVTIIHVSKKHRFKTVYAHLYKASVKEDEFILRGQVIGLSGDTGSSTGPHLHLEIWKSYMRYNNLLWKLVNPEPYCKGWIK